jgi:threonylcarbamoyladenosine tRNA methylthiotransferase MtaB
LKSMRRRYLTALYTERVAHIRRVMPHACIGVDVIVGFPGETETDFLETYNYLNALDISYLHVFTYSERDNTDAAGMAGAVPLADRKKRNKMLRILSAKKLHQFYALYLGTEQTVLFEHEGPEGWMHGFTANYIKVKTRYDAARFNQTEHVRLSSIAADGLVLINNEPDSTPAITSKAKETSLS